MVGTYAVSSWAGIVATTGIILGAAYMLLLYRRVAFGDLTKDDVRAMPDLNRREMLTLAPIAAVVLWMGVYPESFMKPMRPDVARLVERIERARPAGDSQPTPGNPAAAKAAHGDHHGAAPAAAHGEAAAKTETH